MFEVLHSTYHLFTAVASDGCEIMFTTKHVRSRVLVCLLT